MPHPPPPPSALPARRVVQHHQARLPSPRCLLVPDHPLGLGAPADRRWCRLWGSEDGEGVVCGVCAEEAGQRRQRLAVLAPQLSARNARRHNLLRLTRVQPLDGHEVCCGKHYTADAAEAAVNVYSPTPRLHHHPKEADAVEELLEREGLALPHADLHVAEPESFDLFGRDLVLVRLHNRHDRRDPLLLEDCQLFERLWLAADKDTAAERIEPGEERRVRQHSRDAMCWRADSVFAADAERALRAAEVS
eukprot:CAMPEP_0196730412 /NCGR_PEP_ID=MMETSP1091-20130531/10471_1 /TAXON_ID=302021 /ORGANISM="Rhodomonas sp., Strain CCMP768" /LENGTH=248 /DNA_ID=CAMNT_0042073407 /DNA_START=48 /DNA_END=792 /DNA_ORIENTATION=-